MNSVIDLRHTKKCLSAGRLLSLARLHCPRPLDLSKPEPSKHVTWPFSANQVFVVVNERQYHVPNG